MPPAAPPLPIRVCPKHGLVAGPDGRCMICHRGDVEANDGRGPRRLVVGLVALAAILAVVAVWRPRPRPATLDGGVVQAPVVAPPPAPPPPDDEEPASPRPGDPQTAVHVEQEQRRQRDIEAEMRRVPIRMYMGKTCDICDSARDWLKEKGMTYSELDVNADPAALEALKKLTPSPILPTFDVDGEVLVSFAPTLVLGAARRAAERRTRF